MSVNQKARNVQIYDSVKAGFTMSVVANEQGLSRQRIAAIFKAEALTRGESIYRPRILVTATCKADGCEAVFRGDGKRYYGPKMKYCPDHRGKGYRNGKPAIQVLDN
jgi:hypothetical protein